MTALDRLADCCGIQHVSEDAFGKEHVTPAETKRALLQAMRFAAEDEQAAEASLEEIEAQDWDRALPPVCVAYRQGAPIGVTIVLHSGSNKVRWSVTCEDDQQFSGVSASSGLPLLQTKQSPEGHVLERRTLFLPSDLPFGYHVLRLEGQDAECSLIVTPGECWLPSREDRNRKLWGIAAQLYLVRSAHNWGIGDFTDLGELVRLAQQNGANTVGINPLHAMFPDNPEHCSPYSPSDRLLLNILYIDVENLPELASSQEALALIASEEFRNKLKASREAALVDYSAVTALKLPVLRHLYSAFETRKDPERQQAFAAFRTERRTVLDRACLFQALRAYFTADAPGRPDCTTWPAGFQSSTSPEVQRFAEEHQELIRFQLWMQWVADEQLRAARDAGEGMAVGLYRDLAVGAHPSGAEVWRYPEALVSGASVGAPPDIWNPAGQNWGLPPLHPLAARQLGYRSFIELLQANMRYAGALRIDHALALQRLYWIPSGNHPKDGAYVQYDTDDLVGIVALESHRNQCLVIGEDLGTVPKGFRERMAKANILSYRVLFLESDEAGFVPAQTYPELSLCVASSHDLPTLRGWWQGTDIDLKKRLHLYPDEDGATKAHQKREEDREALIAALAEEHLLTSAERIDLKQFCDAAHRFLHKTQSFLTLFQLDDITGEEVQVNVPATSDENPNWRRKFALSLEQLEADATLGDIARMSRL